jgi:hypothetical protein
MAGYDGLKSQDVVMVMMPGGDVPVAEECWNWCSELAGMGGAVD